MSISRCSLSEIGEVAGRRRRIDGRSTGFEASVADASTGPVGGGELSPSLREADPWLPVEGRTCRSLVEPVGGRELLGPECRHRRFPVPVCLSPQRLDGGASGDGGAGRDRSWRPRHTTGGGDPLNQFVDGARFTVRHHQCSTSGSRKRVESSNEGVGGIVDPGGIDEGESRTDERHAPSLSAVEDPSDQLCVARADHEMGSDRYDW